MIRSYNTAIVLLTAALAIAWACHLSAADTPKVKLTEEAQVVKVEIDGKAFTQYHYADDFIYPYVRPFLWPVLAADGTEVSIDQAQYKELHPHQRSIWIGHRSVNGANHWKITTRPIQPKQRSVGPLKVEGDTIEHHLCWEDKEGKPMLNETRILRFSGSSDGVRALDVTMRFTPIDSDVVFAEGTDDGIFAIRPIPSISHQPQLLNSTGATGEACYLKRADWCDESGDINGHIYGMAILDHPENPRHPPPWHARIDARLSADPFALHQAEKSKYPKGSGDLTMAKGTVTVFRYRLLIHTGDAQQAKIADKYQQYITE